MSTFKLSNIIVELVDCMFIADKSLYKVVYV